WLESEGFKVNVVYTNGVLIDFSGTAGQVHAAFHTEIHNLDVKGVKHIANMSDPQIPAALAPAVVGVVSLHDFKPHTNYKPRTNYTVGGGYYLVVPGDLATIYNLNPLFTAGTSGQGQTIVVIEDTDVYNYPGDWNTFRSEFGLSSYTDGSFTQVHPAPPTGTNNCTDPGTNGDDGEAILDAEYSSAAAPSAAIELASCEDTSTFGGLIAIQNLLNGSATPPAVMSMSYGECETFLTAAGNAAFNAAFQQAVTESVSFFVSTGDEGAASCSAESGEASDTYGIGVNGFASTPYNVAVGGTDFGDTFAGTNTIYWANDNNPQTYESALSYIPEIPWNDSCASLLGAEYSGYSQTYGSSGFCNSSTGEGYLSTTAGSGGPSGCATGSPSVHGVVGGSCAGWAKPTWQSLFGNPSDTVRDLPDVSLFAGNGIWGHYYVYCWSDPHYQYSEPCTGAPENWSGGGGTSFASPIMAGIQALVNQKAGGAQGPVNPIYYQLAAAEYGASGNTSCNSTLGNAAASSCIFYDVTLGDMDVSCLGNYNCYLDGATNGVLSTSDTAYEPTGNLINGATDGGAYPSTNGWDFATGIGTVNAANLVNNWPASLSATTTMLSSSQNPANQGASVTFTATVTTVGTNNLNGTVTFYNGNTQIGTYTFNGTATTAMATLTTSSLPVGTDTITAGYGGDTNGNAASTSTPLSQVINPVFTLTNLTTPAAVLSGESTTFTVTVTAVGSSTFAANVTFTCSGLPANTTCSAPPITATTPSPVQETVTIQTTGPNQTQGEIRRRRADNRSPWLPLTLPLAGIVMAGVAGRKVWKHSAVASLCLSLMLLGLLVACGGKTTTPTPIVVAVSPGTALYPNDAADGWPNQTESFTATVTGTSNTAVTWSLSSSTSSCPTPYTTLSQCGQLSSTTANPVTYTAPTIASGLPSGIIITATSAADTTKNGQSAFNLNPATVPGTYPTVQVTATEAGAQTTSSDVTLTVN
ncbi:MAG: Ig-like domain repeat protein, partial [Terriglobales bacterium]